MLVLLKKFFFIATLNSALLLMLIIGIQNSSYKKKVNLFIGETINLPISFIIGISFITGSVTGSLITKNLSVRQVEKITSEFKRTKKSSKIKDPNITDLEKELSDKIGLKTSIHFNENGSSGSLTMYYSDLNQLDDLMKRLKKQ